MTVNLAPEADLAEAGMVFWHWTGIPTLLRSPYRPDMSETDIGLIGFPYAGGNAIEHMQYLAPRAVRSRSMAYRRIHRGMGIDPFATCRISDLGDVPLVNQLNPDLVAADAEEFYRKIDAQGIVPVTIGGDHSVTTPILRGIAGSKSRHKAPIGMIHFDAHCDAFGPMAGTRHHAGAAFRIGVEEGLIDPKRTVQIGFHGPIAAFEQDQWALDHFRVITLAEAISSGIDAVAEEVRRIVGGGPTYISLDLDVLDISYAPAVADPEVNGMTARELFGLLDQFRGLNICGADIVCLCPPLDGPAQITTLTACGALLEFVTLIADFRKTAAR